MKKKSDRKLRKRKVWVIEAQMKPECARLKGPEIVGAFAHWSMASPRSEYVSLENALEKLADPDWVTEEYDFRIRNIRTNEVIPRDIFGAQE